MAKRLTHEDRIRLETLLKIPLMNSVGLLLNQTERIKSISARLGVNPSTIYREVIGNGFTYETYNANKANLLVRNRISAGNTHYRYTELQKQLILDIFKDLATQKSWSLSSLKLRLSMELPEVTVPSLETLYSWIYEDADRGGNLYTLLGRQHKKRKKQYCNVRFEKVTDKTSIAYRPEEANNRKRIGDFEADSVMSCGNKAGVLTATDRKSRLLASIKVKSKSSEDTNSAMIKMLKYYKLKTLTTDNGTEFAGHKKLSKELRYKHYHADPYASYQRGSNEHSNGMLRRYYPKETDFTQVTDSDLQQSVWYINHLPRKIHGGLSVHEVYYGIRKTMIRSKHRKLILFAFRTGI